MSEDTLVIALLLVGLVLGLFAVIDSRGRDWAGWGVAVVAVALLITRLT